MSLCGSSTKPCIMMHSCSKPHISRSLSIKCSASKLRCLTINCTSTPAKEPTPNWGKDNADASLNFLDSFVPIHRWNTSKQPIKGNNQSMSSDIQPKIHRKSSIQYYNIQPYNVLNQSGNKSSSYPSFGSNQTSNISNFQRSASREKLNQFSLMQQQHQHQFNPQLPGPGGPPNPQAPPYHRHSLNNLMPFNSAQAQFMNRRNSSCGTDRTMGQTLLLPLGSHEKNLSDSGLSTSMNSTPSTASDINSRLESLCRQMTEQAIN